MRFSVDRLTWRQVSQWWKNGARRGATGEATSAWCGAPAARHWGRSGSGGAPLSNAFALETSLENLVFDTIEHAHEAVNAEALSRLFEPACRKLGFSHMGAFSVL